MIRIAIVEDEEVYVNELRGYLERYEKESKESLSITVFSDGDEIIERYKSQFDIILMDIQMQFTDGMTAAEEIRKSDSSVVIIFITNMVQYAIRGYAVDALDYVLKPVTYFALSQRLSRAIQRMHNRQVQYISISVKGGVKRQDVTALYYIESLGHTLIFHTVDEKYESYGTMKEIEEKLKGMNFFRGNKGYLINLAHVEGISDGCALVKDEKLVLSRGRKNDFMEVLNKYWSGVIK